MKHSLFILICLVLGGGLTVSAQPAAKQPYQELKNLAYLPTGDTLQMLNLVVPLVAEDAEKPPLLLWLGGGAWAFVNRHQEMPLARKLAEAGIAVASVGHRLSTAEWVEPERTEGVQHPAHAEDAAAAFAWLKEKATTYGYDPDRIFIGGYSCGAYLAAILGSDPRFLQQHGFTLDEIAGLLPIAGTYNIPAYHKVFAEHENPDNRALAKQHVEAVFGSSETGWLEASPTEYLDQVKAPMLLMSEIGLYRYTKTYEEAIRASAYRGATIYHVLDLNHAGLWRDMAMNEESRHRRAMADFIHGN
ncbi:MAG: alpha/beta hydrolase [Bacteroidota bacterium]